MPLLYCRDFLMMYWGSLVMLATRPSTVVVLISSSTTTSTFFVTVWIWYYKRKDVYNELDNWYWTSYDIFTGVQSKSLMATNLNVSQPSLPYWLLITWIRCGQTVRRCKCKAGCKTSRIVAVKNPNLNRLRLKICSLKNRKEHTTITQQSLLSLD